MYDRVGLGTGLTHELAKKHRPDYDDCRSVDSLRMALALNAL